MSLPYSLDLTALAAAYAQCMLTPASVVRDIYQVLPAFADNPIWIHVLPQDVVDQQATGLEARRRAGEVLPLYGIPFAVKDNIDVAGCPTTAACPAFAYVPEETAYAAQRLL